MSVEASVIVALVGVIISVVTSALIVGVRWGKMETKLDTLTRDVSEIRGMFTLTLKEPKGNDLRE